MPALVGASAAAILAALPFYPGSSLALDFTAQKYQAAGSGLARDPSQLPGWSFSRTGQGYAERSDGTLVPFASGVPRITDKGLLIEEARTNVVFVSDCSTAILGVPGSGGSFPSTAGRPWVQQGASNGVTMTVTAVVTTGDVPEVEITWSGTPTATSSTGFYFDTTGSAPAASSGQTYTTSAYIKVLNSTGMSNASLNVYGRSAAGAGIESGTSTAVLNGATARTRYSYTYTMANASTARVVGGFAVNYTSGVPLNAVIRIAAPQVELGAFATSYIYTNGASATRGADVVSVPTPSQVSPMTLYGEVIWNTATTATAIYVEGSIPGAVPTGVTLSNNTSGATPRVLVRHGAARLDTANFGPSPANGSVVKMAGAYDGASASATINGVQPTLGSAPAQSDWSGFVNIGARNNDSHSSPTLSANTYIRKVAIYPSMFTAAQLQALTQ